MALTQRDRARIRRAIQIDEDNALRQRIAELEGALADMVAAFGENDGRIPADGGNAMTIAEAEAANRRALRRARTLLNQ